jgi:hypothetical protein
MIKIKLGKKTIIVEDAEVEISGDEIKVKGKQVQTPIYVPYVQPWYPVYPQPVYPTYPPNYPVWQSPNWTITDINTTSGVVGQNTSGYITVDTPITSNALTLNSGSIYNQCPPDSN